MIRWFIYLIGPVVLFSGCESPEAPAIQFQSATRPATKPSLDPVGKTDMKTENQWRKDLNNEQFRVLRQCGTEPPFQNAFWDHHEAGTYHCAGCGLELFSSETKYDSGTGWPSFFRAISESNVTTSVDHDLGYARTEIKCAGCGGHLGHVFDDGPPPTGLRYCMNSAAMKFVKKPE